MGTNKTFSLLALLLLLSSCLGSKMASSGGGEVTGASGRAFSEPTPYGMTLVKRGHLKMGIENQDTLWGKKTPLRDISVEGFWMDETEVTNSMYRQFVNYVRDSSAASSTGRNPCLVVRMRMSRRSSTPCMSPIL